ncbi:MAG: protein RarD [Alphaproteobacteria bacterium]|nr:protein RarD [Alphaproteobacteria bacterium]|tara:strand:- start:277 stop:1173 length:897 start_codon:yes stop_codon:yes gene_type:complete
MTPRRRFTGEESAGLLYGLGAFGIWSVTPFYFDAIERLRVDEIVAHRFIWCLIFMLIVLSIGRQWTDVGRAVRNPRVLITLFLTAVLISVNWGTFIFSVLSDQLLASSLGYFLSPLVNVFLGFAVLRERLSPGQQVAVALAAIGVTIQIVAFGQVPWIALTVAFSFGTYGLLRKTVDAGASAGLFVECSLITPFAVVGLLWLEWQGVGAFGRHGVGFDGLIIFSGVVTGLPLLLFTAAARRVRLATIGLMQYIAPSTYLVMALTVFPQPFGIAEVVTFAFIWAALIIYTAEIWRTRVV